MSGGLKWSCALLPYTRRVPGWLVVSEIYSLATATKAKSSERSSRTVCCVKTHNGKMAFGTMPEHTEVEQTRLTQIGFSSAGGRACMCYQRQLVFAGLAAHVNFKQSYAVFGRYVRHSVPRSGRIHNVLTRVFAQRSCPFRS